MARARHAPTRHGDWQSAQADFDKADRIQPASAENYLARADYFAAIGQAERAIRDYTLALNLKLERTDIYAGRAQGLHRGATVR